MAASCALQILDGPSPLPLDSSRIEAPAVVKAVNGPCAVAIDCQDVPADVAGTLLALINAGIVPVWRAVDASQGVNLDRVCLLCCASPPAPHQALTHMPLRSSRSSMG